MLDVYYFVVFNCVCLIDVQLFRFVIFCKYTVMSTGGISAGIRARTTCRGPSREPQTFTPLNRIEAFYLLSYGVARCDRTCLKTYGTYCST